MENRKAKTIQQIDRLLNDKNLLERQRQTLDAFDRFNELERQCRLNTRHNYIITLHKLGVSSPKPYEDMRHEDLQLYISDQRRQHRQGYIELQMGNIKRFFRWIEWKRQNKGKPDEQKVDIKDVKPPYQVSWIKVSSTLEEIPFEDLPTEEEILRMARNVDRQRDRALILVVWESGGAPVEVLNLRIRDVVFNQYGAVIRFKQYVDSKLQRVNELKTEFRYRRVPVASCTKDLSMWISMHPRKHDYNAPLFVSQKGGRLSYSQFHRILENAWEKARVKKPFRPYNLRHLRISQWAEVLPEYKVKMLAGHSKTSTVTSRYLHADEQAIEEAVYKERGIEVREEKPAPTPLQVKTCPRCHERNSPAAVFCQKCSCPLDAATMCAVNERADGLFSGVKESPRFQLYGGDGLDVVVNAEWWKSLEALEQWRKRHPNRLDELHRQMWHTITAEVMQIEKAKAPKP